MKISSFFFLGIVLFGGQSSLYARANFSLWPRRAKVNMRKEIAAGTVVGFAASSVLVASLCLSAMNAHYLSEKLDATSSVIRCAISSSIFSTSLLVSAVFFNKGSKSLVCITKKNFPYLSASINDFRGVPAGQTVAVGAAIVATGIASIKK